LRSYRTQPATPAAAFRALAKWIALGSAVQVSPVPAKESGTLLRHAVGDGSAVGATAFYLAVTRLRLLLGAAVSATRERVTESRAGTRHRYKIRVAGLGQLDSRRAVCCVVRPMCEHVFEAHERLAGDGTTASSA
jgi:hypothetical protein